MPTSPVRFKRSEVSRVVRGIEDSGNTVERVTVSPNGTITAYPRMPSVVVETEKAAETA